MTAISPRRSVPQSMLPSAARTGVVERTFTSTADEVCRLMDKVSRSGRLVWMAPLQPAPGGRYTVTFQLCPLARPATAVVAHTTATSPVRRATVKRARPYRTPLILIGVGVTGFTGLFLASAYYLQPLSDWIAAHWTDLLGGAVIIAAILAVYGKQIVHHCPGCRH